MYELFENVSNNDFIWIQCYDEYEKREVVQDFIKKGYIPKLEEIDYEGLPYLIVNLKSKLIYHCDPSMAITLVWTYSITSVGEVLVYKEEKLLINGYKELEFKY